MVKKMQKIDEEKPKEIQTKDAFVSVSRTLLGQTKTENKRIKIRPFVTATATVSAKFGVTIPMGGYSSARADVMVLCPCYVEEIATVYKTVRNLAERLIDNEAKKFEKEMEGGS